MPKQWPSGLPPKRRPTNRSKGQSRLAANPLTALGNPEPMLPAITGKNIDDSTPRLSTLRVTVKSLPVFAGVISTESRPLISEVSMF